MKAYGYCRVSTAEQATEGASLAAQETKIRQYIEFKDWDLVGVEVDDGYSAKSLDRPGIQRILDLVERKEIDAIVIYKLDRLTRNVGDLSRLIEVLDKKKVALVSLQENLDVTTATGRLMVNLIGSVSQWERETTGERTREVLRHKRDQLQKYSKIPYGYTEDNGRLVRDHQEQSTIERIRTWAQDNISLREIARRLNQAGIPGKQGGRWHAVTVKKILTNPIQAGGVA